LFPLLSFVFLGRRCRYCNEKISWQYPIVELATAILFLIAYIIETNAGIGKFPISNLPAGEAGFQFPIDFRFIVSILRDWIVIASLIIIFVYDLRWMIIPDSVIIPAIIAVIILNLFIGVPITMMVIGLVIGLGFFALQYLISKGVWVGGGDLRLGALMGALLGWPVVLVALFLAYIIGAIAATVLIIRKKVTAKSQVPFGVFLVPATIIALFWGEKILSWYLGQIY